VWPERTTGVKAPPAVKIGISDAGTVVDRIQHLVSSSDGGDDFVGVAGAKGISPYRKYNENIEVLGVQINRHFDNGLRTVDAATANGTYIVNLKSTSANVKKEADRIAKSVNNFTKITEIIDELTNLVGRFSASDLSLTGQNHINIGKSLD
jgi:hypothetical protein